MTTSDCRPLQTEAYNDMMAAATVDAVKALTFHNSRGNSVSLKSHLRK